MPIPPPADGQGLSGAAISLIPEKGDGGGVMCCRNIQVNRLALKHQTLWQATKGLCGSMIGLPIQDSTSTRKMQQKQAASALFQ